MHDPLPIDATLVSGFAEATETRLQRFSLTYEYPVAFTEDLFSPGNDVLADAVARREPDRRHRIAVFIDEGVAEAQPGLTAAIIGYAAHHAGRIELVDTPEIVPGGEACKNDPALVESLQHRLLELRMDRHSFVLAIGGGAVLDLVGYVAATTHRGVRLLRVPTTVLAQADSGVGVKNGVNAFGVKNLLGAFVPPFAVLNDFRFLTHLPRRDQIAGMAEAVKVALIRDGGFFAWIEARAGALGNFDRDAAAYLIRRCAELHMRQIANGGDPFEWGSARPLDYGHWSAHKLEGLTQHALRHGEAVAIGMALDARYSVLSGLLTEGEDERICRVLERLGFRPWHDRLEDPLVIEGLREFREHLGGELTITLLAGIGRGVEVHEMDLARIAEAIGWLKQRAGAR